MNREEGEKVIGWERKVYDDGRKERMKKNDERGNEE